MGYGRDMGKILRHASQSPSFLPYRGIRDVTRRSAKSPLRRDLVAPYGRA
jgi:hypothetical protein